MFLRRAAEAVAAVMMAAMFGTFLLQILVRYTGRLTWLAEAVPLLDPVRYGWTLEFCLALWVWIVFWGGAFVVREDDHVTFDILREAVPPRLRRAFIVVGSLSIAVGLILALAPTWDRFTILRLKKTATLSSLFGDWIRMRDVYSIYALFLIAVPCRYLWRAWQAARGRA
ncbi:TRAP transporter small permease [Jannaschia seosinensis]|nr:TRAP transporter small permease subunit [Jannaschia seosinensis]